MVHNSKCRSCPAHSGDSRGGLGGPCPPRFLLGPPFGPPSFFLFLRSFGWHMQGCQMRFVKVPAILSTAPDLSCVVIRKRHRENRETISIIKRQLMICPYCGWLVIFRYVCDVTFAPKIASTAANKLRWRICPDKIHYKSRYSLRNSALLLFEDTVNYLFSQYRLQTLIFKIPTFYRPLLN